MTPLTTPWTVPVTGVVEPVWPVGNGKPDTVPVTVLTTPWMGFVFVWVPPVLSELRVSN